jgi:hypothetical protein
MQKDIMAVTTVGKVISNSAKVYGDRTALVDKERYH